MPAFGAVIINPLQFWKLQREAEGQNTAPGLTDFGARA